MRQSAAARTRDRLVHHYFDIDIDIDVLWTTVSVDARELLDHLESLGFDAP